MFTKFLVPLLAFGTTLLLNLWVWFFPSSFVSYLKLAKNPKLMGMPLQDTVWKFIESPSYIWFPRVIFGLAFIIVSIMIYQIYSR